MASYFRQPKNAIYSLGLALSLVCETEAQVPMVLLQFSFSVVIMFHLP